MTHKALSELREEIHRRIHSGEGLRPLARELDVPLGVLRSLDNGLNVTTSNAEKLAASLGWEFYIGPPRQNRLSAFSDVSPEDVSASAQAFKALRADASYRANRSSSALTDLTKQLRILQQPDESGQFSATMPDRIQPFLIQASSTICPELHSGDFGYVEPNTEICEGDLLICWRDQQTFIFLRGGAGGDNEVLTELIQSEDRARAPCVMNQFLRVDPVTWTGRTLSPFLPADYSDVLERSNFNLLQEYVRRTRKEAEAEGRSMGALELAEKTLSYLRRLEEGEGCD